MNSIVTAVGMYAAAGSVPVSIAAANAAAATWCVEVKAALHSEICAVPDERLEVEREVLAPLPSLRRRSARRRWLRRLKLATVRRTAPEVLLTAKTQRWTPEEVLRTLVEAEIAARDASNTANRFKAAAFPVIKTLEGFDVSASSIPQATVDYPASLLWIRAQSGHYWSAGYRQEPRPDRRRSRCGAGRSQGALLHRPHKPRRLTTVVSSCDTRSVEPALARTTCLRGPPDRNVSLQDLCQRFASSAGGLPPMRRIPGHFRESLWPHRSLTRAASSAGAGFPPTGCRSTS